MFIINKCKHKHRDNLQNKKIIFNNGFKMNELAYRTCMHTENGVEIYIFLDFVKTNENHHQINLIEN